MYARFRHTWHGPWRQKVPRTANNKDSEVSSTHLLEHLAGCLSTGSHMARVWPLLGGGEVVSSMHGAEFYPKKRRHSKNETRQNLPKSSL